MAGRLGRASAGCAHRLIATPDPIDCAQAFRLIATTHSGRSRPGCGWVSSARLGDLRIGIASTPFGGIGACLDKDYPAQATAACPNARSRPACRLAQRRDRADGRASFLRAPDTVVGPSGWGPIIRLYRSP